MPPILNANDAAKATTADAARLGALSYGLSRILPFGYVALCALYGAVAWLSFGYDDEFSNITMVERYGLGVLKIVEGEDVHPPGQYFINWLLHTITGDWSLVRLAAALLTALSLIYATEAIRHRHGDRAAGLLFVLLCLNPALLLWCTGLIWTAYFMPVLVWLSITPARQDWRYWAKCFGGLLLLGYIGYAVFVVALPVLLLYWTGSQRDTREKIRGMAWGAGIAALLYAWQFHIFLAVHLPSKGSQVSSLAHNLVGFAVAQLSNQGVFPVSVPAVLSALGVIGLVCLALRADGLGALKHRYAQAYWIGAIACIALGIAGKFRNLVLISPWQAIWLSTLRIPANRARSFALCFAALAVGNLWGDFNVVTHQNTTKNSWNLDLAPVLAALHQADMSCGGDLIVVSHDPVLAWHVDQEGYPQLIPFSRYGLSPSVLGARHRCVVVIRSYAGMFDTDAYRKMNDQLATLHYTSQARRQFGTDANFRIKQRLDPRYPEYQFEVTAYRDLEGLGALTAWQPIYPPESRRWPACGAPGARSCG